jgi:putative membrane protein insertion efficiency factor
MNSQSNNLHMNLPARAAVGLVRFYQRFLSTMKPPTCRFYPTCSEYGLQAIAHRGVLRGGILAAWRVLRCNPFSAGGYDPGPWTEEAERAEAKGSSGEERGCGESR